jgi:SAM-dependent methyltransferase
MSALSIRQEEAAPAALTASLRGTRHYDRKYYEQHLLPRARVAVLQRLHAIGGYLDDACRVLDFGCSDGSVLEALPARWRAGVEVNPFSRALARERGLDVRASLEEFSGATFDRVVSCHCLEHVEDPSGTLRHLAQALAPGGRLVLNLPMNDCRDRGQRRWRPDDMNQHLFAWTPMTLGNLLAATGYRPLEVRVHKYLYPSRPPIASALGLRFPRLYHVFARCYGMLRKHHQLVAVAELA